MCLLMEMAVHTSICQRICIWKSTLAQRSVFLSVRLALNFKGLKRSNACVYFPLLSGEAEPQQEANCNMLHFR